MSKADTAPPLLSTSVQAQQSPAAEKPQQCPVPCWLYSSVQFALPSKEGNELLGCNFLNGLHSCLRGMWEANPSGCGLKEPGVLEVAPSHGSVVSPLKTSVARRKK